MDVVLFSLSLVTVLGAAFMGLVVIPARRRGQSLVNRQTMRRLLGHRPAPTRPKRRRGLFAPRPRRRATVDLTPLLSQGVSGPARSGRRHLTKAS